ncbi:hypothetical protein Nepgr_030569 [Nepenthes gracilis]|uniref:BZIP domain-containing protein n=1 Tax=Nepenthes gracilis TaxID=150966 RepID=A0AAD3Y6P4_NEPGR|nr:hypothetical protein Nepgr_030569 [Nepenthes gracilis]
MAAAESEDLSHGEVASAAPTAGNPKNQRPGNTENSSSSDNSCAFPTLGRQLSIYSLTLDEFQHTICESGKNFGSMNMDEFLNSIWTAEENQALNTNQNYDNNPNTAHGGGGGKNAQIPADGAPAGRGITKQPSLPRQGSLTLPAPLCRKTVDEVWSEIQRSQQQEQLQPPPDPGGAVQSSHSAQQKQPTFGEMTLEDFLVKAGVVREPCTPSLALPQPPPAANCGRQCGLFQDSSHPHPHPQQGPTYGSRPMACVMQTYQAVTPNGGGAGETSGYGGSGGRSNGYPPPPAAVSPMCYGGRANNGVTQAGGYLPGLSLGSPVSPLHSDAICGPSHIDNSVSQYGLDLNAMRGRKRSIDSPVEKVVERRQRRMIKNRESAARSRARKQAYTVELEAELNQLREENKQLKQALAEIEKQRKQQVIIPPLSMIIMILE